MDASPNRYQWLTSGDQAFAAMLDAVAGARGAISLESYIFAERGPGPAFREALIRARRNGVEVRVMVDAWGSLLLPSAFWEPLLRAGAEVRTFNPLSLGRISHRNHRKLLVCDRHTAFVGGFNVMPEQAGDGLRHGWLDVGLRITGPLAGELESSFDTLWSLAGRRQPLLPSLHWPLARKAKIDFSRPDMLLVSGPGIPHTPIGHALLHDFHRARTVQIASAYFLPAWHLRKALMHAARRGGSVELLLAGKSDVPLARRAGRHLYRRLLRAGVRIYEYQPQILHAKLTRVDGVVYAGSVNLDTRSFRINYELAVRVRSAELAGEAGDFFAACRSHAREITADVWARERSLWEKIKERLAYLLLARLDPYVARLNLGRLR